MSSDKWELILARLVTQVHVRTKPCYRREDVSCNCAVAVREGNHVLGVHACDPDKPPVAVRYLDDPLVPGATIHISRNGRKYTVNEELGYRSSSNRSRVSNTSRVSNRS